MEPLTGQESSNSFFQRDRAAPWISELARYDAVIFFESAAVGGMGIEGGNPIRNESLEQAVKLDHKLRTLVVEASEVSCWCRTTRPSSKRSPLAWRCWTVIVSASLAARSIGERSIDRIAVIVRVMRRHMRVELVNTGTELLLGDTINTNAAWIGQRLAALGIQVARQTIVPDGAVIRVAIAEAAQRSDVVLVSGGLGPTNDDLTRESTAELLSLPMELNEGMMEHLERPTFSKRQAGERCHETSGDGAERRERDAEPFGTAPGLVFPGRTR
jgi:molybdenum cofactor synthesis domain-containing protein